MEFKNHYMPLLALLMLILWASPIPGHKAIFGGCSNPQYPRMPRGRLITSL